MKKKEIKLLIILCLFMIPINVFAECTEYCSDIAPAIRIVKYGMVPLFQIIIPIGLIVMGSIDFAKAVVASKEDEMKKAQSMFIKRCLYAMAVFFVITIVTSLFGLFETTGADKEVKGTNEWWKCYNSVDECKDDTSGSGNITLGDGSQDNGEENDEPNPAGNGGNTEIVGPGNDNQQTAKYNKTIFVGDSRTVEMCKFTIMVPEYDCEIAEVGQGSPWLKSTAIPKLESKLSTDDKVNVVIMMGVNDIPEANSNPTAAANAYIPQYNSLASKYSNTNFIVVSATQVEEGKSFRVTNANINSFNSTLKSGLNSNIKYCDVHSKIAGNYKTRDGVHYEIPTYQLIYESIRECL